MTQTAEVINFERPVVKADIEKGFTRIANELTEALMTNQACLNGREFQIVHAIIHKTFRYQKSLDWISSSQLAEMTGIDVSNISKVKRSLVAKKVLLQEGNKIGINTVVSDWQKTEISQKRLEISQKRLTTKKSNPTSGTSNPTRRTSNSTNPLVKSDSHNKKDNYTKDNNTKDKRATLFKGIPKDLPKCIPEESLKDFIQHRHKIKKPMTDQAIKLLITRLEMHDLEGYDVKALIENAIMNGWQSVYPKAEDRREPAKGRAQAEGFDEKDYGQEVVRF